MFGRITFAALVLTAPILTACTDQVDDELDVDDATTGDAGKADIARGTYTYYFVEADLRRCASPYCGGVYYRLANAGTTRCFDGKKAERCYAAGEDFSNLGLGEAGMAKLYDAMNQPNRSLLVRARIGSKDWGSGLGSFAELRATEAWVSQTDAEATGPIAKIEDSGVRCIAAPCPSLREKKLNSSAHADIADLGWDRSGATDEQIGEALERMHTDGLIVAGSRYTVSGPAGEAKARTVTQFWLRITDEAVEKTCYVGGCSGQICSDEEGVISTCEWRPEYACYQSARCEVQTDGACGWTQTSELQACLANP